MPLCGFAGSPHWLHQWMASPDFSFHVCLFCFCFVLLRLFVLVFVFFWFVFCVYSSLFSLSLYLLFHEKLLPLEKKKKYIYIYIYMVFGNDFPYNTEDPHCVCTHWQANLHCPQQLWRGLGVW